jgi:hypothetical protein
MRLRLRLSRAACTIMRPNWMVNGLCGLASRQLRCRRTRRKRNRPLRQQPKRQLAGTQSGRSVAADAEMSHRAELRLRHLTQPGVEHSCGSESIRCGSSDCRRTAQRRLISASAPTVACPSASYRRHPSWMYALSRMRGASETGSLADQKGARACSASQALLQRLFRQPLANVPGVWIPPSPERPWCRHAGAHPCGLNSTKSPRAPTSVAGPFSMV